jgi:hypothetical protein
VVQFGTVAPVFPDTGAMVSGPVRGPGFPPPQLLWFPTAPEGTAVSRSGCASFPLRPKTLGSLDAVRDHFRVSEDAFRFLRMRFPFQRPKALVRSARCVVFRLRPRTVVPGHTACWVPPALSLWFPTASEDTAVRLGVRISFHLHPRALGSQDAMRDHFRASEDAFRFLRGARSSAPVRGQWFPSALRAGSDLYRARWFQVASEDASLPRRKYVFVALHPKVPDISDAWYFAHPASEDAGFAPYRGGPCTRPEDPVRSRNACLQVPAEAGSAATGPRSRDMVQLSRGPGRGRYLRPSHEDTTEVVSACS